jgi:hypothetical protein
MAREPREGSASAGLLAVMCPHAVSRSIARVGSLGHGLSEIARRRQKFRQLAGPAIGSRGNGVRAQAVVNRGAAGVAVWG